MHFSQVFLLPFAVTVLVSSIRVDAFDYNEIEKWNASCFPKDTCSVPRDLDHSGQHNCDCSSLCVLYDTCCIDSPLLNISSTYERMASCRAISKSGESVFMIDVCASSYQGPADIRRRCEQNSKNWSDPFNNIPVTNPRSQKTFKSLFCALCNDEDTKELVMWHAMLDCSSLSEYMDVCTENRDFVLSNMMYIREKGLWGLWSWDSKTDWKFRYLPITFAIPPGIKKYVRSCRSNLVSTCDSRWRDSKIEKLCRSYMGAIYFDESAYRNVHCALCNDVVNMTSMSCHDNFESDFRSPTMSFGLLLDINLKDGETVGMVDNKCGDDQVFDPFSKKCRDIECPLPGYTLKEGKCVQE